MATSFAGISGNFNYYRCFIDGLPAYQSSIGRTFNYSSYTCDNNRYMGDYVVQLQNSCFNGTYPDFVTDQIINGNINPQVDSNIASKFFFEAYDYAYGIYPSGDYAFETLQYLSDLDSIVRGRSYTY